MVGSLECYPTSDGELVVGLKHRVDILSTHSERALSGCGFGGRIGANESGGRRPVMKSLH